MDDYISRRCAKAAIQNALYDGTGYGEALDAVLAADVQPVVLCKDCRHSYDEPGGRVCSRGPCVDSIVADDFFCKYGERREGGTDG